MLPLLWWFFAHLLILQYPDHHQNLISSSWYYSGPLHKISSQSVYNVLSNVVHRQTDKQTNQRYQKHDLLCQGFNNEEEDDDNNDDDDGLRKFPIKIHTYEKQNFGK